MGPAPGQAYTRAGGITTDLGTAEKASMTTMKAVTWKSNKIPIFEIFNIKHFSNPYPKM